MFGYLHNATRLFIIIQFQLIAFMFTESDINRTRKSEVNKQFTNWIKRYLKQNEKSYVHVPCHVIIEVKVNLVFNVTFNDISVIYVTAHRCAGGLKKKLNLRSGSQRHRHFVGFFNVPVQAPTRDPPFYGFSEKPPHFSRLLRHAWGYGGHILDLTPRVPTGEQTAKYKRF